MVFVFKLILLLLFILTPIIFLGITSDKRGGVLAFPIFTLFLAILSYFVYPKVENDLFRYFEKISSFSHLSFQSLIAQSNPEDYGMNFLFWILGKNDIPELLPFLVVAIVYGIIFYVYYDICHRTSLTQKTKILFLLFLLSNISFYFVTTNIRNVTAFSCIILGCYRDFIQRKKGIITSVLYILPCIIHISSISLLILRMMLPLFIRFKFMFTSAIILSPVFVKVIHINIANLGFKSPALVYFQNLVNKADYYFFSINTEWAQAVQKSGFQKVQKSYHLLLLVCILITIRVFIKKYIKNYPHYRNAINYTESLGYITLTTFLIVVPTYVRYLTAFFMIIPVFYLPLLNILNISQPLKRLCTIMLFIGIPLGLTLQFYSMIGYIGISL